MKKIIYTLVLGIAVMGTLSACGNNEKTKETTADTTQQSTDTTEENSSVVTTDMTAQEIADKMLAEGDFKDTLATVDKTMALTRLYGIDETLVEDASFYTNSNATAEEIAVIKLASADNVEVVKTSYQDRISAQEDACRDYLPDEMPKLEDAVVYSSGNYVILCVSNDSDKIEQILQEIFG